nr:hypothetical protein 11 [bacterium]
MTDKTKFFEIFKAGTYPQGVFTNDDIEAIAKNYDPSFCEAPITLDHEQKGPALGWIKSLIAENGVLKAEFRDVDPELVEKVKTGKYKNVSVELYKILEGRKPYLKSLSFLGAAIPQVKGLEPVKFRDAESETYILEKADCLQRLQGGQKWCSDAAPAGMPFNASNQEKETEEKPKGKEDVESLQEIVKLQNQIADIESRVAQMIEDPQKDDGLVVSLQEKVQTLSAKIKKFEESETARQKTEQELAELKQKMRSSEFEQFLNEQDSQGNLTPVQKELGLKLFTALDNVKRFDESDSDYIEEFKKFIKTLPKQVDTKTTPTAKNEKTKETEFAEYENADEESFEIFKEVKQLSEKENISFRDALIKLYK